MRIPAEGLVWYFDENGVEHFTVAPVWNARDTSGWVDETERDSMEFLFEKIDRNNKNLNGWEEKTEKKKFGFIQGTDLEAPFVISYRDENGENQTTDAWDIHVSEGVDGIGGFAVGNKVYEIDGLSLNVFVGRLAVAHLNGQKGIVDIGAYQLYQEAVLPEVVAKISAPTTAP